MTNSSDILSWLGVGVGVEDVRCGGVLGVAMVKPECFWTLMNNVSLLEAEAGF